MVLMTPLFCISQEKILYSFYDSGGSVLPEAGVISDRSGNLYGTTFYSGAYGMGMVYELTPTSTGWKQTILHSFNVDGVDGFWATGGLVMDASGNLYGTTEFGGSGSCTGDGFGCGTVFELSPSADGSWTEIILHDFTGADGWQAYAGLVFDRAGNLYGTTANGGNYGQGTVFEMSPSGGVWTLSVLHHFTGGGDGGVPWAGVTLDGSGHIFGATSAGGGSSSACKYGCGTVFELIHTRDARWTGRILHNFTTDPSDGHFPSARLVFDSAGNLYGTTPQGGGTLDTGIVFELLRGNNGTWTESVLHNFNDSQTDGAYPSAPLIFDGAGNLYSATLSGGLEGQGTVFELTPASDAWNETILHSFTNQGTDGAQPSGGLIFNALGHLFGTTGSGGQNAEGTVFEIAR
jgi:uncharacterized repeat protein (TIGR03803 family)